MHHFSEKAASTYGVHAAVLLQNIYYWCQKNKANRTNFHDGYFWTYNSEKAFTEIFWYLSKWQIRTALKKLQDDGAIITGNYNQNHYDRTLWYAITEKGINLIKDDIRDSDIPISKLQKTNLDVEENQFQNSENPTPIPNIKPDINKTDIKPDSVDDLTRTRTKTKKQKSSYGEYQHVQLTDNEYSNLCNDYGDTKTHDAIKFLDEYIEEKGYKSKSHNLALRRWVYEAVEERKQKTKQKKASNDYDWANL